MRNFLSGAVIFGLLAAMGFIISGKPHIEKNPETDRAESEVLINKESEIKFVRIGGREIKVDLALTPLEQERGLSGRKELQGDEGMLFVFPTPGKYYFWMKDMKFAIDIIWVGEDLRVIYIKKDAQPASFPKLFGPALDAKYVLEVTSGFSDKNNVKVGDRVELLY